ncbi:MAG TPA: GNAT family N-acetyltransferase [Gammaproteobacteria bacterium]|nr:GNAT family N-acetyltransferase [Gammaproteobacteria bacterium]
MSNANPNEALQLRVARHTERLDEVVAFYRDGLGLPEIGRFHDHAGYAGVFLAIPGTGAHLELTAGGAHGAPAPHPESLLVLYVGDRRTRDAIAARLQQASVAPANPYWAEHGTTFEDPDGFRVVLVPHRWPLPPHSPVTIEHYDGPRARLRTLFELAEDSAQQLDSWFDAGRVLVAWQANEPLGCVQLVETARADEAEIKSIAVHGSAQGRGIGRALVAAAAQLARESAHSTLVVATATADIGNLRFYQRLGFRMRAIERDVFTPAAGYPPGLVADGIEVRDRVWFERPL